MRSSFLLRVHAPALLVLLAVHASATNLSFLKDSPVSYFNERDVELMMAAADEALSDDSHNATREWKNEETGNFGRMEVLGAFNAGDGRV
jgi:hypothetical protein